MQIQNNINLINYNTFKVKSIAKHFVQIQNESEIVSLLNDPIYLQNKKYFLGSGANTIFVNNFDGLVIKINILGKEILSENDDEILIKVGAGENWHNFVLRCADNNFAGLENLAYIPSSIGASAVQNVGAYGVEAKNIIQTVDGINLDTKEFQTLKNKDCNFGYRDSIFKNELKDKFIITHVVFRLKKFKTNYKFNCEYTGINEKISQLGLDLSKMKISDFVEVITQIRKEKLPDWELIGTAGSFFKNPIIPKKQRETLYVRFPELKGFDSNGAIKLSAGQLIDLCGFKGKNNGKVGTYKNHALILVNEGTATGQDIKDFAEEIQIAVQNKFNISLEPEAIFVE
ncbi:MAG: UDP-N-acetylmuramate dehydrogenase [Candidatus Absconditabacterales bacterium]|nr:UDP-N-acetylmuramate dehydrogenase [Candidatus Absconditabacterales bacterium]